MYSHFILCELQLATYTLVLLKPRSDGQQDFRSIPLKGVLMYPYKEQAEADSSRPTPDESVNAHIRKEASEPCLRVNKSHESFRIFANRLSRLCTLDKLFCR